jgi:hypothetical protein
VDCYPHHRVIKALVHQHAAMRALLSATIVLVATSAVCAAPESEHQKLGAPVVINALPSVTDQIPQIIPGVQVGPVKLGMSAYDGAGAALRFEAATGCQIDLLIVADRVAAAGTRFGGCLELSLPEATQRIASTVDLASDALGMDGPASAFIAAFGDPLQVRLTANRLALIWPQGLVAHVGGIHDGDGNVTYLAVVMPGTNVVPAIGYLRISLLLGLKE